MHPPGLLLLASSLLAGAVISRSQPSTTAYVRLSAADGLYGDEVHCILQDSRGLMWFGTDRGLNCYDGRTFTVFRHEPGNPSSIIDAKVQSLCEDRNGVLWVGTWRGLEKFDRTSNTFTHYLPMPRDTSTTKNFIYDLREDRTGTLWAGGYGVKTFERSTGTFNFLLHDSSDPGSPIFDAVDAIFEDRAGTLWIGTGAGLDCYDRVARRFVHYWVDPHPRNPDYGGPHWIQTICEDRRGMLWLGTNAGPVSFNRQTGKFKRYRITPVARADSSSAQSVSSVLEDEGGTLWISTWGGGCLTYDAAADSFVPRTLGRVSNPNTCICTLYMDKTGTIWIGTQGEGIVKMERTEKRFTAYVHDPGDFVAGALGPGLQVSASLQNNDVRFIYQYGSERVCIGTATGLDYLDRERNLFEHFAAWEGAYSITGHLEVNPETSWTGLSGDGLNLIVRPPYQRTFYSTANAGVGGSASSFYQDRNGLLWMLTSEAGLCQFDVRNQTFKTPGIGGPQPFVAARMIVADSLDSSPGGWRLWIGTADGLWRFNARSKEFARFGHDPNMPSSLPSNTITTVTRDSRGTVWVGTDRGLSRFDTATGQCATYGQENGLPDTAVLGIVDDGHGRLWVSTPGAIARFDPVTSRFTAYSMREVLPSLRFGAGCCLRASTGELYFGGNGGFVVFHPDSIRENPFVPPVRITGFSVFDRSVALDSVVGEKKAIGLLYSDNVFSFEFAALNYRRPELNAYAYRLEGYDAGWVYSGTRASARYLNVPPGRYTFRVKGSNDDGVWNEEGASIALIIAPPWWKSTTATVFLWITLAGALMATAWYVKFREMKRRVDVLERERVVERERARISQDMHDDVGSSLSEIAILSQLAKRRPDEAGTHVEEISARAEALIDNVSEIIWAMNPKNDTLDNFVAHLRRHAMKYLGAANVACKFSAPEVVPAYVTASELRRNMFLVVKEALHNIVKHAGASQVAITVTLTGKRVEIVVEDNGKGFVPEQEAGAGNGLANMQRRIADVGGSYTITSRPGDGTRVTVAVALQEVGNGQVRRGEQKP